MTRPIVLAALVLVLLACGRMGPPARTGASVARPAPVEPGLEETEEPSPKEKTP